MLYVRKDPTSLKEYYVIKRNHKIPLKTKLLRIIVRYIIPVIFIVVSGLLSIILTSSRYYDKSSGIITMPDAIIMFIALLLIIGSIASLLAQKWFDLISLLEDK